MASRTHSKTDGSTVSSLPRLALPIWSALAVGFAGTAALAQAPQNVAVAPPPPPPSTLAAAPAPPASPGGYLSNNYFLDDGTTDGSIGLVLGGTICWFQRFDTRPAAEYDVIDTIQVAYGFPGNPGFGVPNGTAANVAVWEDPTDDGDPADAVLLRQQATTVQGVDTNALNSVTITPVTVRGRFFVGAFLQHFQQQFPASRDLSTTSQGRAFFVGTTTANGTFDPAHLAGLGHTQIFSLDTAGSPPGSFNSVWRVRAVGQGPVVSVFCGPKVNSLGCTPLISASGVPQASSFFGFVVSDVNVRNQKVGLVLYGITGQISLPFQGGLLCIASPIKRSPSRYSGGNALPAVDCSGRYELDMNAFAHGLYGGTPLPALSTVGTLVECQWWGRDPGFPAPNNSSLSAGLEYPVIP